MSSSEDDYHDLASGKLHVQARWTNNAGASGYQVVISTTEPKAKEYARCSTGRSCTVPQSVPIVRHQELSFKLVLVKTATKKVVAGFRVCLVGA